MKELAEHLEDAKNKRDTRIRQGKVVSIQTGPPRTLTVLIGGTNYANIRCMDHVDPVVNEGIWLMDIGVGRWIAFGNIGSTFTRPGFVRISGDTMTGALTAPGLTSSSGLSLTTGGITFPNGSTFTGTAADSWDRLSTNFWNAGNIIANDGYFSNGNGGSTDATWKAWFNNCRVAFLRVTGGADSNGNIRFDTTNPYITAPSYIVMPGGLYVNGGTLYITNPAMARGGISNDSGTYAPEVRIIGAAPTTHTWSEQQLGLFDSGGNQHSGMCFNTGPTAPIVRGYGPFGDRIDILNNANTAYVSIHASAFTVESSERVKVDIAAVEDDDLLIKIGSVQTHRFLPKVRPQTIPLGERFVDVNSRWTAKGHKPLTPLGHHYGGTPEDHDCSKHTCKGDAQNPCPIAANDTHRFGIVAEHLHPIAPEATTLDEEGLPAGYDVDQVAAMAFGGVGALLRKVELLTQRIAALESQ